MIAATETRRYELVWDSLPTYGDHSPGMLVLPMFLDLVGTTALPASVVDLGCGSGRVGVALSAQGFDVTLADLTPQGLSPEAKALPFKTVCVWHGLRRQLGVSYLDYVFCVDVLEHVPEALTMLAVDQMLRVAEGGVFLGVALVPDEFGVQVGETLHQTVKRFVWWRDMLRELGTVHDARDLVGRAVFWVTR